MKKLLLSILFCNAVAGLFAQSITYQKTLDEAMSLAAKGNKPVFIFISTPVPAELGNANAVFKSGLDSKDVADFYSKKFISFKAPITDSAGIKLRDKYHLSTFPAYIFLDVKGNLVYKANQNTREEAKYIDMANKTLQRIESGKTLSYYEDLDKKGSITADQLKDYITYKEELNLFDNGALAEEYVSFLTVKSLEDYNTVLFVLKASPIAYGKAFNLVYTNRKIIDSIYKREPLSLRKDINNHISVYTRNEAIRKKDIRLAQNAAAYSRGTWGTNAREAAKAYTEDMLYYYKGINDTLRYFQQAGFYYDTYYMNISVDSAKKLHQQALQDALNKRIAQNPENFPQLPKPNGTKSNYVAAIVSTNAPLETATKLNTGAWDFYSLGTKNPNNLVKALLWVRRAIQLESNGSYFDTMAHVMYRLNFYEEAVINENKAIELAISESQPKLEVENMKTELQKMKSHSL